MHPAIPGDGTSPAELAAAIEAEIASIPDLPDPPPVDEAAVLRQVDHNKRTFARLIATAGPEGTTPAALMAGSHLSSGWVHGMLADLLTAGAVTKLRRGVYQPVPGRDIWAGVAAILQARDVTVRQLIGAGHGR